MIKYYYLWSGVDAIEDFDDDPSREEAIERLMLKSSGDWTLWERKGLQAKLVAIKSERSGLQIIDVDPY